MRKLNRKQTREIRALARMKDSKISLEDAPEGAHWNGAVVGKFYRPIKKPLTIRLDADVLALDVHEPGASAVALEHKFQGCLHRQAVLQLETRTVHAQGLEELRLQEPGQGTAIHPLATASDAGARQARMGARDDRGGRRCARRGGSGHVAVRYRSQPRPAFVADIVHRVAMEADVPGLENVANLDRVPERGAWVLALPMKIRGGSGGPLRIVAVVPR